MDSDKRTNKAIEQKRPPTPTLPLRYDPTDETFKAQRNPEKWQTTNAITTWTCPKGEYEAYIYKNSTGNLLLNGHGLEAGSIASALVWLPATISSQSVVIEWTITGEIGTPGSGDTALLMTATAPTATTRLISCPGGWRFTEGDIINMAVGTFDIRFRRIS